MSKSHPILIGVLAGLATALLYFSSYMVGVLGKLPLYIAPLPIYLAVMSFGSYSGLVALITAVLTAFALAPTMITASIGAIVAFPALLFGYQATLFQNTDGDAQTGRWYPLEDMLFNLAIAIGAGVILIGVISGFDTDNIVPVIVEQMNEIARLNPELKTLGKSDLTALAETFAKLIPFFYPIIWLVTHVINAHLAAAISRNFGRFSRPEDDFPLSLNLPLQALVALPTAMILMIFGAGTLANIAAVFFGCLFMSFAIVGLGALHLKVRGKPVGRPLMIVVYLLIFLFTFPLLVFAIAGVARSISRLGKSANPVSTN